MSWIYIVKWGKSELRNHVFSHHLDKIYTYLFHLKIYFTYICAMIYTEYLWKDTKEMYALRENIVANMVIRRQKVQDRIFTQRSK